MLIRFWITITFSSCYINPPLWNTADDQGAVPISYMHLPFTQNISADTHNFWHFPIGPRTRLCCLIVCLSMYPVRYLTHIWRNFDSTFGNSHLCAAAFFKTKLTSPTYRATIAERSKVSDCYWRAVSGVASFLVVNVCIVTLCLK